MHRGGLTLIMLASVAFAFSTTYTLNTTLETISSLIDVQGDFSFSKVIPGQEYQQNFTVRWAVPPESLKSLDQSRVVVHVLASAPSSSWVRFRKTDRLYKAYAFTLECNVQNGSCRNDSTTSHTVEAIVLIPINATSKKESVQFTASLSEAYRSELASSDVLGLLEEQAQQLQEQLLPSLRKGVESVIRPSPALPIASSAPLASAPYKENLIIPSPTVNKLSAPPSTTASADHLSTQTSTVDSQKSEGIVGPFSGFLTKEFKDVLFAFGIFAILGLLWLLGKLFPETPKGL